jgi:hypothetical protein
MVNFSRRSKMHGEYAFPLLLGFGLLGARLNQIDGLFVSVTVMLLCCIIGLQNASD